MSRNLEAVLQRDSDSFGNNTRLRDMSLSQERVARQFMGILIAKWSSKAGGFGSLSADGESLSLSPFPSFLPGPLLLFLPSIFMGKACYLSDEMD